jgi:8-amino-7-oxononanoate synthase
MRYNDDFLSARLNECKEQNFLRQLQLPGDKIDFCSTDYLGIIRNRLLRNRPTGLHTGSGGTRTLSGNYRLIESTEEKIAAFHNAEAALIFSSGYDANLGVLASVPQRGDTLLFDELSHPSVKDGAKITAAQAFSFTHNDLDDLKKQLQQAAGNIFVYTEAVFDSDGSRAPLERLVKLCNEFHAHLIINESHSIGVFGEKGEGLIYELGLEEVVFARIHGFGNACGCHGAVVMGSEQLKSYLFNFCNQLMHSTTLSEQTVATIWESYKILPQLWQERDHLNTIIQTFQDADLPYEKLESDTPIQHLLVDSLEEANHVTEQISKAGFDVRPIFYPAVPKGEERVRIVLHSFNTRGEVSWLIQAINSITPVKSLSSATKSSSETTAEINAA